MTAPGGDAARSEAQIIEASLSDGDEFAIIYERYFSTIYSYVARRLGPDAAGDLAADVFLRAFEHRHRYDLAREFCRPWLYGIASNVVRDHLRKQKRKHRAYLHANQIGPRDESAIELQHGRIEAALAVPELNGALAKLKTGDREVLLLVSLAEMTYEDTAQALGIPIGTVRSRLFRARKRMQELLPGLWQTRGQNDSIPFGDS